MHFKAFLCFTLLGSSTARTFSSQSQYAGLKPRDVATLVTIKSSLKHGTELVNAVDTALKAVTAANVKEQLGTVNSALMKLSSEVTADTKKMRSSGTIGIGEVLGLLQEGPRNELLNTIMGLFTALNNTATTLGSKRDIIKNSGAVDVIVPGIKAQRQGLVDIVSIVPSQVPAIAKGPINGILNSLLGGAGKGAAPAAAAPPAILRRQAKGKGGGGKTGGGGAKSGGGGAKSSGGGASSGGGITLESLLSSPESLENIGKGIDTALDRLISWLKGTTEDLIPPELLEAIAKGMPKGPPKGAPKGGAPAAPAAPKALT